jgi:hypothetical protein
VPKREELSKSIYSLLTIAYIVALPTSSLCQEVNNWTFSVIPADGQISGSPGSTIGWGFQMTNNSPTQWLFASDVTSSNLFAHGIETNLPFTRPVLAPGTSTLVPYNGLNGLISLTWDADAPIGFTNVGVFEVEAQWYDGNPDDLANPGNYIGDAGTRQSPYTATVSSPVPYEPSTGLLIGIGAFALIGLYLFVRRLFSKFGSVHLHD